LNQIKLDKGLLGKELNNQALPVQINSGVPKEDSGLSKMYIDVHEPEDIITMLSKEKGIYLEVKSLPSADYAWSNIGVERKTLKDFYGSIVSGDKRIWRQMFNLKYAFERPMLIIERWDQAFLSDRRVERTIYGAMASIFLMGISIVVIPGRSQDIRSFVDLLSFLFFSSDKKALSMRPIRAKSKTGSKEDVFSDMLSMIPMIGRKQANDISKKIKSIEELCSMTDEELKTLGPSLGRERMAAMRWVLNGKNWERKKNGQGHLDSH